MFLIIIAVALILCAVPFWIVYKIGSYDQEWALVPAIGLGIAGGILAVLIAVGFPVSYIKDKQDIAIYKQQKTYIEEVLDTTDIPDYENYSLTLKRIELNEWLYERQYAYEHYSPWWEFVPDEIMELEPIK